MIVSRGRYALVLALSAAAVVGLAAVSLALGRFAVPPGDVLRSLWSSLTGTASGVAPNAQAVIVEVRAPRVAAALAVGAALAGAGASYQSLFKNPLVSPDILGVSSGCSLGAGLAILLTLPVGAIQALAFAGGLVAVGLVILVGGLIRGRDPVLSLVLTGVVVGSLFAAGVALVKYLADPYSQLPALTFWLLGSFTGVMPRDLGAALPAIVLGIAVLALLRWRLDVLSLSEDEAASLGVAVGPLRFAVVVAATLVTAAAVALAGTIGWVGLVVPHAARLLGGAAFARVLPLSLVLGAGFLLGVDTICRVVFTIEVPPGVATAFVGTPAFLLLLAAAARKGR
jgi:iron complex transport system permease protein